MKYKESFLFDSNYVYNIEYISDKNDIIVLKAYFVYRENVALSDLINKELPLSLKLKNYFSGNVENFYDVKLNYNNLSKFERDIIITLFEQISYGSTVSYSELAQIAGYTKKHARAAANVVRKNRWPLIVPCHRVISNCGNMGGFMGKKSGWQINLKRKLLLMEGSIK